MAPSEKDELIELHALISDVSQAMKDRLVQKYYDGYRGWDNPDLRDQLKARALQKVLEGDFIDAMNLCAMVYNIDNKLKEENQT